MQLSLPNELNIQIIEANYLLPDGHIDSTTLSACSLVHSSWKEPAQRLLFHAISGHGLIGLADAISAKQISNTATLLSYIRRLHVNLGHQCGTGDDTLDPQHFFDLLMCCSHLYELTLSVFGVHEFDQEMLLHLKSIAASIQIRALRLERCGVQSPILYQLLTMWPGIQFLTIGAEMVETPPTDLPKVNLKELMLSRSRIPPEFLSWLLSDSDSTLQILELRDIPGQQLKNMMMRHGPHLRSFRVLHFNRTSADILRQCTRLEEFVVYHIPVIYPLENLPTTIEHLSFRNPTKVAYAAHIIPVIEKLPNLRVITFDESIQNHLDFSTLRSVCDAKGVAMRLHVFNFRIVRYPYNILCL